MNGLLAIFSLDSCFGCVHFSELHLILHLHEPSLFGRSRLPLIT